MTALTTVADMRKLNDAFSKTFGGTGDPRMFSVVIQAPFNSTVTDTLKEMYTTRVFVPCFIIAMWKLS